MNLSGQKAEAPRPACHLSIKLASTAPVAVLLRRGPTEWTQLIKWHVENDLFETGQWFRGRIYEEACSLSDDGELFLYLARKGTKKALTELGSDVWTALSRPPYFTALALWPHAGYGGGGRFTGPRAAILNVSAHLSQKRLGKLPRSMSVALRGMLTSSSQGAESAIAVGWQPIDKHVEKFRYHGWQLQTDWEKQSRCGALHLLCRGRRVKEPCRVARIVLTFILRSGGRTVEIGDADFAEFDQRQRLIMGRNGKILVCVDPFAEAVSWRVVADFTHDRPSFEPPPEEARRWP